MADQRAQPLPAAVMGKGKRVVGMFAFMIGASLILDTGAVWLGLPIIAVGLALLVWGLLDLRSREMVSSAVPDVTESRP